MKIEQVQEKQDQQLHDLSLKVASLEKKLIYTQHLAKADILSLQAKISELDIKEPKIGQTAGPKNAYIYGKNDWIYVLSGTNRLTDYHTGKKQISVEDVSQWGKVLTHRKEWHQDCNIKYLHLFIPNKICVYPEFYPRNLNIVGPRPMLQLQQKFPDLFVYPLEELLQKKKIYRLYDKLDSHWNFWGCYFTYEILCNLFDIPIKKFLDFPTEIVERSGGLGKAYGQKEKILWKKIPFKSKVIYDNQVINYAHQGSVRILKNENVPDGKMIIFGDSFCNMGFPDYSSLHPHRLSSLFGENFHEVHFVWTPWVDYEYVKREKPDFVLTEMAERFMIRVPDDFNHPPIDQFAKDILAKHSVENS